MASSKDAKMQPALAGGCLAQQESNLLFGILAVQLRLITPQQLAAAGAVWATAQDRQLGDILLEQRQINSEQCEAIAALIRTQLAVHHGDPSQVYELYGGDAAAQASFGG